MSPPGGGFYASLDADSEGEEGKFYVWSKAEIEEVLGEAEAKLFCEVYDVTGQGNWEGHTVLNRLGGLETRSAEEEAALAATRARLLQRRAGRVRPGWDDKVLADWNGLMIAALAHAARVFEKPEWLDLAKIRLRLRHPGDGGTDRPPDPLLARRPAPGAGHRQRLRQHDLGCAAGSIRRLTSALSRRRGALGRRARPALLDVRWRLCLHRRRCARRDRAHALGPRRRCAQRQPADGLQPGRAASATGKPAYLERDAIPKAFAADERNTFGHCGLIAAAFDLIAPQHVVVIEPAAGATPAPHGHGASVAAAGTASPLARAMFDLSLPGAVEQVIPAGQPLASPSLSGKTALAGKPTAYACLGPQCSLPVTEPEALLLLLRLTAA